MQTFDQSSLRSRALCLLRLLAALLLLSASITALAQGYVLGEGDVVSVSVYNNPDLATTARVSAQGNISFPLLGNVKIGGLTESQAQAEIASRLSNSSIVVSPQVSLLVQEYQSQKVSVLGEVSRPGIYPLKQGSTVVGVLALAGGPKTAASPVAVVTRGSPQGQRETIRVDIAAILERGEFARDITLQNGDVVFVPSGAKFYIYGEVSRPGEYVLKDGLTVMQALSVAGGLTNRGTERGMQVRRRLANGGMEEIPVSGHDSLMADDVIFVKESLF